MGEENNGIQCRECHATLVHDQRYCMECGARRGPLPPPFAAIIGGLGSIYGAILGGFLFAGLQIVGTVLLPLASAYKDVFAFAVVIALMAWRPTGLIREKISERV